MYDVDSDNDTIIKTTEDIESTFLLMKIELKNELSKSIWYPKRIGCGLSFWGLEKFINGSWEKIYLAPPCIWEAPDYRLTELKPSEKITEEVVLRILKNSMWISLGEGSYRLYSWYSPIKPKNETSYGELRREVKTIYSNEFTIK